MKWILSTSYLPPIPYFSLLFLKNTLVLDGLENFQKQSFRNRAQILSPQGKLVLTVPVQKYARRHTPIKEVRISYESNWQKLHWMSLQSCYRRSTYFEFYEDDIIPFFEKPYTFLWDLNLEWMEFLCKSMGLDFHALVSFSEAYIPHYAPEDRDLRDSIHPKHPGGIQGEAYPQVFDPNGKFYEDLSVIDVLFNMGKQANPYLNRLAQVSAGTYLKMK